MGKRESKRKEKGFTKTNVDKLLIQASLAKMRQFYALPFQRLTIALEVEFYHDPIFLADRYVKYSRRLAQSKWMLDTGTLKVEYKAVKLILISNLNELRYGKFFFTMRV